MEITEIIILSFLGGIILGILVLGIIVLIIGYMSMTRPPYDDNIKQLTKELSESVDKLDELVSQYIDAYNKRKQFTNDNNNRNKRN